MNIMVFAPHPDDEVLGAGGTIAKRVSEGHNVYVVIATKGYPPTFDEELIEAGRCEAERAHKYLGVKQTIFLDFPALSLDKVDRAEFNGSFSKLIDEYSPNDIYIPHIGDMHIDHREVAEAVMVAARPFENSSVQRIYSYETMSETGWHIPDSLRNFSPNTFVNIGEKFLFRKKYALSLYASQVKDFPNARSVEAVDGLARYRGSLVSCNAAEAFCLIRQVERGL
ncbi:MAG: PIG-L family deacetylase [Oscillospiraceae bacterium]|nr:PIG-L family deacetylase [Oscillospiraceae bacterium]